MVTHSPSAASSPSLSCLSFPNRESDSEAQSLPSRTRALPTPTPAAHASLAWPQPFGESKTIPLPVAAVCNKVPFGGEHVNLIYLVFLFCESDVCESDVFLRSSCVAICSWFLDFLCGSSLGVENDGGRSCIWSRCWQGLGISFARFPCFWFFYHYHLWKISTFLQIRREIYVAYNIMPFLVLYEFYPRLFFMCSSFFFFF